jgi:hypothetical protein
LLRSQLAADRPANELFVVMRRNTERGLGGSLVAPRGDREAVVAEIARKLHAEFTVYGVISDDSTSVRVDAKLWFRSRQELLVEPLPVVQGTDTTVVVRSLERSVFEAIARVPAFTSCLNELRAGRADSAARIADAAVLLSPRSVLLQSCLLDAYAVVRPDSTIVASRANLLRTLDSNTTATLSRLAKAYFQVRDSVNGAWATNRLAAVRP